MSLGGSIRTTDGLRFVRLNASALAFDFAVLQIPGHLDEHSAQEFRDHTMGLEIVLQTSRVNPAASDGADRTASLAAFHQQLTIAHMLNACAMIVPAGDWAGSLRKHADASLERQVSFFETEHDGHMPIWLDPPNRKYGRRNALAVAEGVGTPERDVGLIVGVCHYRNLWWTQEDGNALLDGPHLRAFRYQSPRSWSVDEAATHRHTRAFFQRLKERPLVVDHPSLAVQSEITEGLRKNLGMVPEEVV